MDSTCITLPQHGIIVSTAAAAGGNVNQHAEASSS